MSDRKRHIDQLFRKGLSGRESLPPPEVWNGISTHLRQRKRSLITAYFSRAAAAVIILLGIGGGLMHFFRQGTIIEDHLPETMVISPQPDPGIIHSFGQSTSFEGERDIIAVATIPVIPGKPGITYGLRQMQYGTLATGAETKALPATETPVKALSRVVSLLQADIISDTLPGIAYHPSGIVQKQSGRWFASIMLAPNYSYRNLSAGNAGEFSKSQLNHYESGLISLSGSISIGYLLNDRLYVQSGLNLVRMGQTINDILVFNDPAVISAIRTNSPSGGIPLSSQPVNNSLGEISSSGPAPYITDNHKRELNYFIGKLPDTDSAFAGRGEGTGRIIQGLSYLQIPLELRYLLVSGNTDLVVSSGLGINFLTWNNVMLRYQGESVNIGHTRNINRFGLSGTVAVALERQLGGNIKLLAEPRLSHFISPVNKTGDLLSRPYAFSFFMGISYGF